MGQAKQLGGVALPNFWDIAALRAYLSGQPADWYSPKTGDIETKQPPALDPRLDPTSPWCKIWMHLYGATSECENN